MTAFENFQEATCCIGEGDYAGATACLDAAISAIDAGDPDADMRQDIADLRAALAAKISSGKAPLSAQEAEDVA